jgi:hypothetical protein
VSCGHASQEPSRHAFDDGARHRDEEHKSDRIGDESRREEQRSTEQDQSSVSDLPRRHLTPLKGGLQASPRGRSLPAQQPRPRHRHDDEQRKRGEHPDLLPNLHDHVQLDHWNGYERDENDPEHLRISMRYPYRKWS